MIEAVLETKNECEQFDCQLAERMATGRNCYTVRHKNTPKFIDRNLKTDDQIFNNFWYEYTRHSWPSNDYLYFRLTERLFQHYLEKTKQAKSYNFIQCNIII